MFPNLPFELRLKIWKFTFPGPRNVGIQIRFKDFGFGGWMSRKRSPAPPVALQVCHESREEALKCYILSFGTSTHPPTAYYNYKIDTLCFGDGPDIHSLFPNARLDMIQAQATTCSTYGMGQTTTLTAVMTPRQFKQRMLDMSFWMSMRVSMADRLSAGRKFAALTDWRNCSWLLGMQTTERMILCLISRRQ